MCGVVPQTQLHTTASGELREGGGGASEELMPHHLTGKGGGGKVCLSTGTPTCGSEPPAHAHGIRSRGVEGGGGGRGLCQL